MRGFEIFNKGGKIRREDIWVWCEKCILEEEKIENPYYGVRKKLSQQSHQRFGKDEEK